MQTSISRARPWPLALTFAAIVTLGACADDDRPLTASLAPPDRPSLAAAANVLTVTHTRGTRETGSLRWAVAWADSGAIIRFDPRIAGGTILLDSTLYINDPITIEADSSRGMTISGGGGRRVIDIWMQQKGIVKLRNLTITGGRLVEAVAARASGATPRSLSSTRLSTGTPPRSGRRSSRLPR